MNTLETLIAARRMIEKPENWTQGVFARNKYGIPIGLHSEQADCFCMSGAIGHVLGRDGSDYLWQSAIDLICKKVRRRSITDFNDASTRKHQEVLRAFDLAIASLSPSDDRVPDGDGGTGA